MPLNELVNSTTIICPDSRWFTTRFLDGVNNKFFNINKTPSKEACSFDGDWSKSSQRWNRYKSRDRLVSVASTTTTGLGQQLPTVSRTKRHPSSYTAVDHTPGAFGIHVKCQRIAGRLGNSWSATIVGVSSADSRRLVSGSVVGGPLAPSASLSVVINHLFRIGGKRRVAWKCQPSRSATCIGHRSSSNFFTKWIGARFW